ETRQLSKTHKLKTTHMNPPSPPPPPQPPKHKKSRKSKPEPQPAEPLKKLKLVDTPPPTLLTHFTQLSAPPFAVSKRLYRNLVTQGYENPTPVQMAAIPLLLLGHQPEESYLQPSASPSTDSKQPAPSRIRTADPINLLTCAQTGSGKTLAYLLPLMDWVLWRRGQLTKETRRGTKVVIAAPTKELVNQIYNEALKLAIGTGVRVSVLRKAVVGKVKSENHGSDEEDEGSGGESEVENSGHENKKGEHAKPKTKVKADIVVSTPTMFLHAIQNDTIDLSGVQRLILDEADVLLERNDAGGGFGEETAQAWGALISAHSGSLKDVRVWMWSATISSGVEELASKMISPTPLSDKPHLGDNLHPAVPPLIRLLVGIKNTSLPHITHTLTYTSTEPGKLLALRNLLRTSFPPPALIFLQTVPRATALFDELQYDLPPGRIALLHAQLSDQEREGVMERFRKGEIWALVTTDLLSRGVDWRGVRLVINYDVPGSAAGYIHRAGRTGRAGVVGGEVITYYTKQDVPYVRPTAEVIVAAEKERERLGIVLPKGKEGTGAGWLLGYLPRVGKREKRRLKKYGVEVRNGRAPTKAKEEGEEGQKRRKKGAAAGTKGIGTTPGWEKQREHRRMGAVEASKKRARMQEDSGSE
ncbi:P-loop containing nucleoside triphosphate hydrolase protein, partial [Kalaharituber pfeilii]